MDKPFNTETVLQTLTTILPVLDAHTNRYWFMGSMIPSAINGGLYRDVHDFDIIVYTENLPSLLENIYALGYTKKPINIFRVSELLGVYVFSHPTLLDIGFFVIGTDGTYYTITSGPVHVEIPMKNLIQKQYSLHGVSYPGIDPSFAYTLCLLAKFNPKRAKELLLYASKKIVPAPWPIYTFRVWGKNANWMVDLLDTMLVYIGIIRVRLGLPYDPWQ
jgi:hypothetical protein